MNDDEKRDLYTKSKMQSHNVKIAVSDPALRDKIRSNIAEDTETIFWYIKFNTKLSAASVSKRTMNVTERNGYVVNTDISYNEKNNMISICPIDCYAQNEYYLLNISRKVKSAKGSNLKREIHILFKIEGNQISEFKVLSPDTFVPKPKKRPKGYVPQGEVVYPKFSINKAYAFDMAKFDKLPKDKLPYEMLKFNPLIAIAGIVATIAGIVLSNFILILIAVIISALGVAHIIFQFTRKVLKASTLYNTGVYNFNKGKYGKAKKCFNKAVQIDENNEYAEFASAKVEFYL